MMRDLQKRRYILAAFLTALVFVLGLSIGLVIEGKRVELVKDKSEELKVDINSLQLQYAFMDQLAQISNCEAFSNTFDRNIESLESTRLKLVGYQRDSTVHRAEFNLLRRTYILSQVQYYLLSVKGKQLCNSDAVNILYFFSKDCSKCDDQSFILSFLKQKFGARLFIFGFDVSFDEEPLLNMVENTYNVTEFPSLVIENSTYRQFLPTANLTSKICGFYRSEPDACKA